MAVPLFNKFGQGYVLPNLSKQNGVVPHAANIFAQTSPFSNINPMVNAANRARGIATPPGSGWWNAPSYGRRTLGYGPYYEIIGGRY